MNYNSPYWLAVSIHAPVKEATVRIEGEWWDVPVSIHAPVKEATRPLALLVTVTHVSIHAPVKEATAYQ